MAVLVACDGEWGLDGTVQGDAHVTCDGTLEVIDNPPLAALDQEAAADLATAAVLVLVVAAGLRILRRFLLN